MSEIDRTFNKSNSNYTTNNSGKLFKKFWILSKPTRFDVIISLANTASFSICIGVAIVGALVMTKPDSEIIHENYLIDFYLSNILIFISTLVFLNKTFLKIIKFEKKRYIPSVFILLIGIWIWLLNFKPFPNYWVMYVPTAFIPIISTSIYLHDYNIKNRFQFITKPISENVKLARVNIEYATWSKFLVAIVTGYAAFAISYAAFYPRLIDLITDNNVDKKLLFDLMWATLIVNAMIFLLILCREFISKLLYIQDQIEKIEKNTDKEYVSDNSFKDS
jgi:hypothetical protein